MRSKIDIDPVAVRIDGRRQLLLSGSVHYPRSTPDMWPTILRRSREAGLNTIETYVFWNLHERQRGQYDFSGRLDLPGFLTLCQQHGMHVILRVGPYICAETNFGGLPPWLLHEPDIDLRTDNTCFKKHVRRWCGDLMAAIGDFQATRGGPILLLQLENEYNNALKYHGDAGPRYLRWIAGIAKEIGVEVPLIMCHGATAGAMETLNGFAVADDIAAFRQTNPGCPAIWTENWPGWYDTWGSGHHVRDARELAYSVIRFFALAGTGVNYYMWHAGTNFGRESMYLQTTRYGFDAPLDEFAQPTAKSLHLASLHRTLVSHADLLLDPHERRTAASADGAVYSFSRGPQHLFFAVNTSSTTSTFDVGGENVTLPATAAAILARDGDSRPLFVFESHPRAGLTEIMVSWQPVMDAFSWLECAEPFKPCGRRMVRLESPTCMLKQSQDQSDYGWYEASLHSDEERGATLTLPMVRDRSSLFVNDQFVGTLPARLEENRPTHWQHNYAIRLQKGANQIRVLVSALGLIKHEDMIGTSMAAEKKGLIGDVLIDGHPQRAQWTLTAGLWGEHRRIFDPGSATPAIWRRVAAVDQPQPRLRWFRADFGPLPMDVTGYGLDVSGLEKGLIWLNGQCAGRYWQVAAQPPFADDWYSRFVQIRGTEGMPTQQYYHLPKSWFGSQNTLVIFEETAARPGKVRLVRRC